MTRCTTHRKDFHGGCMWCGKKLCVLCIAKQEGRKFYCEHCAVSLVPYKREPLPVGQPVKRTLSPTPVPQQEQPAVKRRFMLGKDGYYELH